MIILGAVDGTGVWNNADYARTFEFSHISTLYKDWTDGPAFYERGPVTADNKYDNYTVIAAKRIFNWVVQSWNEGEKAVFLAGYSRGGAAVIEVAKWLKERNIPVECLVLLDPVDRSGQVGLPWRNTPIAENVKLVIYAQRDYAMKSRESFGNCGTVWNPQTTDRKYKTFRCTHGGVGGVPWILPTVGFIDEGPPDFKTHVTPTMDVLGSVESWGWMYNHFSAALSGCKQRLSAPDYRQQPLPAKPANPTPNYPGKSSQIYVVKAGDWLSKIAQAYYGDINKWRTIYDVPENKQTIGPDPNLIKPGQRLIIP
jgi:hypothetical protein